jgi:hypothetical protein
MVLELGSHHMSDDREKVVLFPSWFHSVPLCHFVVAVWRAKEAEFVAMKSGELPTLIAAMEAEKKRRYPELISQFEKMRAERLRARDYEGYLFMFDGHERFPALLKIERELPNEDYWKCLALVWDNIEVSAPNQPEWLRLFTSPRPRRELLMSATERRRLAGMPETLTIYRGYAKGRARSGLSWTLSKERARLFAKYATGSRRYVLSGHEPGGVGMIVSGKCRNRNVLAYFDGREEQEIVIDPRNVFEKRSITL